MTALIATGVFLGVLALITLGGTAALHDGRAGRVAKFTLIALAVAVFLVFLYAGIYQGVDEVRRNGWT